MLDPVSNLLFDDDEQYLYISRTMTLLPLALTLASLIVVTNSRQEFITEPEHQVGTFTSVHAPGSVFRQKKIKMQTIQEVYHHQVAHICGMAMKMILVLSQLTGANYRVYQLIGFQKIEFPEWESWRLVGLSSAV